MDELREPVVAAGQHYLQLRRRGPYVLQGPVPTASPASAQYTGLLVVLLFFAAVAGLSTAKAAFGTGDGRQTGKTT